MKRSDFHYDLPPELIAAAPAAERSASRLLVIAGHDVRHMTFRDLPDLLRPHDLLVFNDTRVIPARLWGRKPTGGRVEILIERILDGGKAAAHLRNAPKSGGEIVLEDGTSVRLEGRTDDSRDGLFLLSLPPGAKPWMDILEAVGHMPLPPYIEREDKAEDRERYQTVYAARPGSVAAPTAGLHFDEALLARLKDKGVDAAFVTLHVGAGTFQPVRADDIRDHKMHAERVSVGAEVCEKAARARAAGGRVVAVGTTSVRCLETAAKDGTLKPFAGETDIFIYPGYRFRTVDALVTNFHLPESTLLMLVSAFAGTEAVKAAYSAAVREKYRFFSYGDAMFAEGKGHGCY